MKLLFAPISLLLFSVLMGVSGCSNSECRRVVDLESPKFELLSKAEDLLAKWIAQEKLEKSRETNICRDMMKYNSKTGTYESDGSYCYLTTGTTTEYTKRSLERAHSAYRSAFQEWSKIINLYPDCFDPEKVIKANP